MVFVVRPKTVSLHIAELDCAEEVVVLRRALDQQAGVERIDFDVLNARMNVTFDERELSLSEILNRIRKTGMTAQTWSAHVDRQHRDGIPGHRVNARFWLTLAAGLCIAAAFVIHVVQSGSFTAALGHHLDLEGSAQPWLSKALYALAIIVGLWFVLPRAWKSIARFRADMNVLMSVAVGGAILLDHWLEAAIVTLLFSVALLLESWSVRRARRAIESLLDVTPKTAHRVCETHGDDHDVPVDDVQVRSRIRVFPGEKIPLDGVIVAGVSAVDQAAITGESIPVDKVVGATVYAGTINGEGTLTVEVTRPVNDTTLARIIHMVEQARSRQADAERWVERFARYYTPAVMSLSVLIFVVPTLLFQGDVSRWAYNALVLLVIACPCALVISTPVSVVAGLTSAAREGIIIKGGRFLEMIGRVKSIAVDKTGTITRGQPAVQSIIPARGDENQLLQIAAALEIQNTHPIARAIVAAARNAGLEIPRIQDYQAVTSCGATGTVDGRERWIGNRELAIQKCGESPDGPQVDELQAAGQTVVFVGTAESCEGVIGVADQIREEATETIRGLKESGGTHARRRVTIRVRRNTLRGKLAWIRLRRNCFPTVKWPRSKKCGGSMHPSR